VDAALDEAEQRGRRAFIPLWRTTRARLLLDTGQLAAAAQEMASAADVVTATGLPFTGEPAALCITARVAFHLGDDASIETCAARAEEYLSSTEPQQHRVGAWLTLITAAYQDTQLNAHQLFAARAHLTRGYVHATGIDPGDAVLLVRAALTSGLRELADSIVEFTEHRAQRNARFPLFDAAARHARGLLSGDHSRLMDAADRYGDTRPLLRAQAWEDAGALVTSADPSEAQTCFERALEGFEACGAERDSRRVRSRLRKLGVKPNASSGAPDAGWRGLTPSELSVVRLIAHGATNRQAAERLFLSPHTVNTHVRHAFEKLGIRSRVQLARLYLREVDEAAEVPA
jgi:DNA-binding CsgD family transcriptional regulator